MIFSIFREAKWTASTPCAIFVAAVEAGSFSAASRKLGVPLPTVSRKVADLEAHLNTRLLVRTTRKLALTDAGAAYLAACKTILEQVGEAERAAAGEYLTPKGDLIIAAPIVFGRLHVLPVVNAFPGDISRTSTCRWCCRTATRTSIDDHIDMAVRIGALPDSSMVATRVGFGAARGLRKSDVSRSARHTENAGRSCAPCPASPSAIS